MDCVAKAIEELSQTINNFLLGAVTFNAKTHCDDLQQIIESFKIRKSRSLLGRAYKEQHYSTINNSEDFISSSPMQSARILERERIITEIQQSALQGMVEISTIERVFQECEILNGASEKYLEIKRKIAALADELIKENSTNTELSNEKAYEDLLLKEKMLIKETQQYLNAISELKEKRECLSNSNASQSNMVMQTVRHKLEQINFMKMLIVNIVGATDVDLTEDKDIADIVFKRCKPLLFNHLRQ